MSPAANLFRVGAFVALLFMIRYMKRTEGTRAATILVVYLTLFACLHELINWLMARATGLPLPYSPAAQLGHVGFLNLVVVAGWVFTFLVSFALAKMIQRRNFPGTNIFLTFVLTALVATAISYCVEITGTRMHLWTWQRPRLTPWVPFGWPLDAVEGWSLTSFMTVLLYCAVRYRLFFQTTGRSLLATAGVLLLMALAISAEAWLGHNPPPFRFVYVAYLLAALWLGFSAPRSMLGSSGAALEDPSKAGT